ncbi:MAG: hypothetical protein M0Z36_02930 [Thermaerobacter sp.]|nr:hypothetical protein [Thermaerobacter sp.]
MNKNLFPPDGGSPFSSPYGDERTTDLKVGASRGHSVSMRYLAQFSEAPRTETRSFWQDAEETEEWLDREGRRVQGRRLTMRARGIRALEPWLGFQTKPLSIDAWLDPMETAVTWTYLVRFLADVGPERVWIPCGEDAWVGWTGRQVVIRAARESWLWALAEDVWDPASWSDRHELEWWSEGRLQHAVKLPWGLSEQRGWLTGWEEWTLTAEESRLTPLWLKLAERLGSRPVRVKWMQELPPARESMLGLRARYITCDLTSQGQAGDWTRLAQSPEPQHIRTQAVWSIPEWSQDWSTVMTLRRVQRGTRLETTYTPRRPLGPDMWRSLQRERRQIPILQIRPVVLTPGAHDRWQQLLGEAQTHHRLEQLTQFLRSAEWPSEPLTPQSRVRLRSGWAIKRWASQTGLWVLDYKQQVEVHVEWPTEAHPGNVGVTVPGAAPLSMSEWVRASRFKRLSRDRRYWASWIDQALMPILERFIDPT